ncbi:MAG TPA: glycine cleavage system aminomethyltransferase GcvT [Thermoanaerobacterales bacterium]|nr:glycine cleavage system aminomethyltransferase GcvT [Thermoanaerobacterales bacterium]
MLKRTPLYDAHLKLKARIVEFGGFEMPVQYTSVIDEHMAVRTKAGVFDVSHMGEILVEGEKSEEFLNALLTNDVASLNNGKVQYTIMTYDNGGAVDDLMVYRMDENVFFLVVNASNKDKDFEYIKNHAPAGVKVEDVSQDYAEIAVQGPDSLKFAEKLLGPMNIGRFCFKILNYDGATLIISRTGYTGEDGLEIYGPSEAVVKLFYGFVEAGITPCGLGARDTLRFEAGLPLYGHELSENITPVEAGLTAFIKFNKDFCGKDVLYRQIKENEGKRLIGLRLKEKGVPRQGYRVFFGGEEAGSVTSGNFAPYLKEYLAMALVRLPKDIMEDYVGRDFEIEIRGKRLKAEAVPKNFLKALRSKK